MSSHAMSTLACFSRPVCSKPSPLYPVVTQFQVTFYWIGYSRNYLLESQCRHNITLPLKILLVECTSRCCFTVCPFVGSFCLFTFVQVSLVTSLLPNLCKERHLSKTNGSYPHKVSFVFPFLLNHFLINCVQGAK